jgi:hypothetical protein
MKKLYLMTMAIFFAGSCTNYIESNVDSATYTFKNMSDYKMHILVKGTYKDQKLDKKLNPSDSYDQTVQERMSAVHITINGIEYNMSDYNPFDNKIDAKQPYPLRWKGGKSGNGLFEMPQKLSKYAIILRYDDTNGLSTALMPKAKFDSKGGDINQKDVDASADDVRNDLNPRK